MVSGPSWLWVQARSSPVPGACSASRSSYLQDVPAREADQVQRGQQHTLWSDLQRQRAGSEVVVDRLSQTVLPKPRQIDRTVQ